MRGNNFFHSTKTGQSIKPHLLGNASISGSTISEPWRDGEVLAFLLSVGVVTGTVTFAWEVRLRGTSTWKDLMDSASTPVDVTVVFANTEDSTMKIAEIPLKRIDSDTYDAIRLICTATNAADEVGCTHVIASLRERPGGDSNALPGTFTLPYTYEA